MEEALDLYRASGSVADVRRLEANKAPKGSRRIAAGSAADARGSAAGPLSAREREVAMLVARGLSNKSIVHFSSRAQLAAYIARAEASV